MVTLLEKKKQRGTAFVPVLVLLVLALMPAASAYTATLVSPAGVTNVHNGDLVSLQVNSLAQNNTFQLNISSSDLNTTGGTFSINNFAMPFGFVNTTASTSLVGNNLNASGLLLVVARADGVTITQQNQTTANPYRIFLTHDILKTSYNVSITGYPQGAGGAIIDFSVRGNITNPNNPAFLNFTISNIQSGHLRIRVNDGTTNQLDTNLTITANPDKIGITNAQQWYLDWNGDGTWTGADKVYSFGAPGWTPVVGDWNATGFTYIGVTNGQQWYLDWNGDGAWTGADKVYSFGAPGWTPVMGDWNNDGKTDIGVTNGQQWYLDMNNNGVWDFAIDKQYNFGAPGWTPVVGDWAGTGFTYIGVTNGQQWYLDWNGNGVFDSGVDKTYNFGSSGWTPLVGTWSAIGKSYIGVTNGQQWYLDWNGDGAWTGADKVYSFGAPGWVSKTGDWNSTGFTYIGVTNGQQWYLDWNGNGAFDSGVDKTYNFGAPGWTPLSGKWS